MQLQPTLLGPKILEIAYLGINNRYIVCAFLDRFGDKWVHVSDNAIQDRFGNPELIIQQATADSALEYLKTDWRLVDTNSLYKMCNKHDIPLN